MFRAVRAPVIPNRTSRPLVAPRVPRRRGATMANPRERYRANVEKIEELKIQQAHARSADKSSFDLMMSGLVGQGILRASDFFVELSPAWQPAYVFTGILFAGGAVANLMHNRDLNDVTEELKAREELRADYERSMPGAHGVMIPGEDHPMMDLPRRSPPPSTSRHAGPPPHPHNHPNAS